MIGITQGQKLQLNVVNLCDGSVDLCDGSVNPEPSTATLRFLALNGHDVAPPVALTLNPSASGFAEMPANPAIIMNDKTARHQIRGQVDFAPRRDLTAPNACANIQASMEIVNVKAGQTTVFIGDSNVIGDSNL